MSAYIPPDYVMSPADAIAWCQEIGLAQIVVGNEKDGFDIVAIPLVHYPDPNGGLGKFKGHLARKNPINDQFAKGCQVLTTFMGPHHYISPQHYADQKNAPSWNYIQVSSWGMVRSLDEAETRQQVVELIAEHEGRAQIAMQWPQQWPNIADAPPDFYESKLDRLLPHITGIEIEITAIKGIQKLDQYMPKDAYAAGASLQAHPDGAARRIGQLMIGAFNP